VNSPLYERKQSVADLLNLATKAELGDLRVLSWAFFDSFGHLLNSPAILNPVFDGSGNVGGADADLILSSCLVEIKNTKTLCVEADYLRQLLGYTLLDFSDRYVIREVGLMFTRQQLFVKWPIDDLIRSLRDGDAPQLSDLRDRFKTLVRPQRRC